MRKIKFLFIISVLSVIMLSFNLIAQASDSVNAKVNLALGAKIDDYCQTVNYDEEGPERLLEDTLAYQGVYETKWCATDNDDHQGGPHWIIIDLREEKTFDSISFASGNACVRDRDSPEYIASNFELQVSSDKKEWTTFVSVSFNDKEIYEESFETMTGRYVRLLVHASTQNPGERPGTVRAANLSIFETKASAPDSTANEIKDSSSNNDTFVTSSYIIITLISAATVIFLILYSKTKQK